MTSEALSLLLSEQKSTKERSTHGSPQKQGNLRGFSEITLSFLSTAVFIIKGGDLVEDLYKKPNQTTPRSLKCMSQFKNALY